MHQAIKSQKEGDGRGGNDIKMGESKGNGECDKGVKDCQLKKWV
jgi:hypothetical protein